MDWTIGRDTIADEVELTKARQIVNEMPSDEDVDELRQLTPVEMTEAEVAQKLLALLGLASSQWSFSELKMVKYSIRNAYGASKVVRHLETPILNITPDCRNAVREIKRLGKMLLECGCGNTTVRSELEKMQMMRVLKGQGRDVLIDMLL